MTRSSVLAAGCQPARARSHLGFASRSRHRKPLCGNLMLAVWPSSGHTGHGCPAASGPPFLGGGALRVLLLNITYEPLTTVCLHRAVGLVLADKADILHNEASGLVLHSASVKLAVPSVIRLRRYVRVPHRNRVPLTRAALMRRDGYLCAYCGAAADTIDHVVPRSRGGAHVWENCVASCTNCNHRKADRLIEQLARTLPWDPPAPPPPHSPPPAPAHDAH